MELLRFLVRLAGCEQGRFVAGDAYSPALNRASSDRIDAMVRLLHTSYARSVTLDEVAAAAHMSPSAASRFFRRTTGITITDYLNVLRTNAACLQLRDTDRRIADIATDCGYANRANFNRRFRELKRTSPCDYRRTFRQAERTTG